jgi:hypothetical protein
MRLSLEQFFLRRQPGAMFNFLLSYLKAIAPRSEQLISWPVTFVNNIGQGVKQLTQEHLMLGDVGRRKEAILARI